MYNTPLDVLIEYPLQKLYILVQDLTNRNYPSLDLWLYISLFLSFPQ